VSATGAYTLGGGGSSAMNAIAKGDFNGDGKLDVAVIDNNANGRVYVYLNHGGVLGQAGSPNTADQVLNVPASTTTIAIVAGDFNNDGKTDLAVSDNAASGFISIYTNNGTASPFPTGAPSYTVAQSTAVSLAAADFNGDGRTDLAVVVNGSGVYVFLNSGATTAFATVSYSMADTTAQGLAAGDFNADGRPDLAVTNGSTTIGTYVYYNAGGTLNVTQTTLSGAAIGNIIPVAGDFNGDGIVDLSVNFSGTSRTYISSGASGLPTSATTTSTGGGGEYSFTSGDLNNDGSLDLIYGNGGGSLFLYYNTGTTFSSSLTMTIPAGSPTASFYYKNSNSGVYTLTASDNSSSPDGATGIVDAAATYTISAGTATVASLSPSSLTTTTGTPTSAITLTTKDSAGNASNVATNTTFSLSSTGVGGQFSLTSSPFTPVSIVTVNSGTSSATFYYQNTNTGSYTLTVASSGFTSGTASVTVNNAVITSFYYATAPGSGTAGSASTVFTVGAKDAGGNVIAAPVSTNIYLYGNGTGDTFSTTSGGTYTSALTLTINSGSPTKDFYYKNNSTAGSPYALTASDNATAADGATGVVDATASYTMNAGTAVASTLSPSTQSVTAGVASSVVTLTTVDSLGNPANVASSTTFGLTSSGTGGTFSTTSGGTYTSTLNVTVNSGTSSTTFFFKNNTSGSYTITAHNAGFSPDSTATVTVNPASIATYYYATAPATGAAGVASIVFTVGAKDSFGNIVASPATSNIYLYSSAPAGTFSTTSGGTYTPALTLTINSGSPTKDFYYKNNSTSGSPYTLTASDNATAADGATGIVDATTSYAVIAGTATTSTLSPASQSVAAGVASSVATLTTKDSLGNIANVGSNTTFGLSASGSGGTFSTTSGGTYTSTLNVTVNSGTSTATFFFKNNTSGSYTITAHNAGFTPDSTATVTVNAATIASFYYATAPATGAAGVASTVFTVGAHDTFGNVVTVGSNTNVYLYSSAPAGTFSTTSGGTYTSALTVAITSGGTITDFYYKNDSTSGSPYTITASDNATSPDGATGIVDATTSYAVTSGSATTSSLSPSSQSVAAGAASSVVTLTTKDSLGNSTTVGSNTTFGLTSSGSGGTFSTTSGGTYTSTLNVTVNSGTSTTTFYYKNNTSGSYTITAHATGFSPDSTATVTVNPAAIASYYYATAPATGAAGASSTVFTVGAHDAFGNVVTVGSNQTVYLYSSAPSGTFSSPTNSNFTATLATILSGNTTANFYYKNNSTSGSPYTLTASDNSTAPDGATGIVDATTSYSVTAGTATVAVLTPSTQSVTAGTATTAITLTTKDSLGNTVPVASNTTFTLSDGGNGGVFSTTGSGGPFTATNITVNSGSSSATLYYKNNTSGSYTLTAHNASFTDGTTSVLVSSAAIASYYFSTTSSSSNINVASGVFTVGAKDVFGNVVTVGSNTTIYLYSTSTNGTFSNTTSAGPFTATTVTILAGNTSASFYYKDPIANVVTITVSDQTPTHTPDTGIVDASTAFTVFNPDVKVGPNMPLPVRSATLNDSRPGDPNVHFSWNSSTASTIKGIRIQVCTDGLKNTACTTPTGSDLTPATLTSTGGELGASGWSITSVVSAHEILITNSTGATTTIGGTSTLDLSNFVNPTSIGTFFFRISTYTTTAALPGDSVSFGTIGTSTNRSLTPTVDVAESLVFRVANSVASDCSSQTDIADPNDAASDLVTLSPNPMTMITTSIGTAQICATANAGNGYTITYYDAALGGATKGFWNGAHEFPSTNQFTSATGTEQFGFNLRANTTPAVGFDPDGNGLVADLTNADYGTTDKFSYNDTGSSTILAQKSSPNAATARYTMSYIANISSTTQGGTYKARQVFVITATY